MIIVQKKIFKNNIFKLFRNFFIKEDHLIFSFTFINLFILFFFNFLFFLNLSNILNIIIYKYIIYDKIYIIRIFVYYLLFLYFQIKFIFNKIIEVKNVLNKQKKQNKFSLKQINNTIYNYGFLYNIFISIFLYLFFFNYDINFFNENYFFYQFLYFSIFIFYHIIFFITYQNKKASNNNLFFFFNIINILFFYLCYFLSNFLNFTFLNKDNYVLLRTLGIIYLFFFIIFISLNIYKFFQKCLIIKQNKFKKGILKNKKHLILIDGFILNLKSKETFFLYILHELLKYKIIFILLFDIFFYSSYFILTQLLLTFIFFVIKIFYSILKFSIIYNIKSKIIFFIDFFVIEDNIIYFFYNLVLQGTQSIFTFNNVFFIATILIGFFLKIMEFFYILKKIKLPKQHCVNIYIFNILFLFLLSVFNFILLCNGFYNLIFQKATFKFFYYNFSDIQFIYYLFILIKLFGFTWIDI